MQLATLPSGLRAPRTDERPEARLLSARVLAVAGVVFYNWWIVVPFVPGLMPSVNGFFSDLEATGRPHAQLMSDADMAAGLLMLAALLLRGSHASGGVRREWKWMIAFAVAGTIGGRFPYACSEGLSASCRSMEWHLQLPLHHYIHVVAGIAEFAFLTTAAIMALQRTRRTGAPSARLYTWVVGGLFVGYPLLGAVYLTDRLGTLVEPIFFVLFCTMLLAEVFESLGSGSLGSGSLPSGSLLSGSLPSRELTTARVDRAPLDRVPSGPTSPADVESLTGSRVRTGGRSS